MFFTSPRFTLFRTLALGCITAVGCAGEAGDSESTDQPEAEELGLWQPAVSEESAQPASCPNSPIDQIQCRGKYCDDIAIHCSDTVYLNKISSRWLPAVSEEDGYASCEKGEVMSGVSCSGKYCDSVSVECSRFEGLTQRYILDPQTGGDVRLFYGRFFVSEEDGGTLQFDVGTYPSVLWCSGKYCDELGFYVSGMDVAQ